MAPPPETAPSPENKNSSQPSSSNSTSPFSSSLVSSSSPPPPQSSSSSPPLSSSPSPPTPSPPKSPPPSSPPPPPKSPPPSSPPPKSPTPSPPPPQKESPFHSPPPPSSSDDSNKSPPPKGESPSSPFPPPPNSEGTAPPSQTPSPPTTASPFPPSGLNSPPTPIFSPPTPTTTSSQIPPSSAPGKLSPLPYSSRAPSHKSPSDSNSSPGSSSSSDVSNVAIIAGITIGSMLLLSFIIVCVLCMTRKRRKPYYMDARHGPKGEYYNSTQQWNNSQDHIVKLPPPPGVMGTPAAGAGGMGGWGGPTPPHIHNAGSDYSSGFSGSAQTPHPPQSPSMGLGFNKSQFTYDELAAATGGFSQTNILGQGGFGYVHKGVLPNGQEVAVKSLKSGSGQGEREFQAEVEIISRVHHRHLVSLVGYCIAEEQRILVYEYVPNKTLEFHLHGKGQPVMDWAARLRIAVGSAKGLAYLHEDCHPRIIHRDIKAANILLDANFEAMVADFGLAKLSSDNFTHVSTRVMGTFGYLAPEYASSGKLSEKSDVFSFGVMLLELITGRRPVDTTSKFMEDSLVDWARPLLTKAMEDGNYDQLVDSRLDNNFSPQEMARMVASAAASIRHSARRRPKMSQIVRALDGDSSLDDLNDGGVKPGQSSAFGINGNSSAYDTGAYNADMMKFRKMVMSSHEFDSSEYGGTNDFGVNHSNYDSGERNHLQQKF